MGSFSHLVAGESKKILRQKPAAVILIILLGVYFIMTLTFIFTGDAIDRDLVRMFGFDDNIREYENSYKNPYEQEWIETSRNSLESSKQYVETMGKDNLSPLERYNYRRSLKERKKWLAVMEYRFEHNLFAEKEPSKTALFCHSSLSVFSTLAIVGTLIVGSLSVAGELSSGTLKLLLIRPFKRWKILTAKFIAVLLYAILLYAVGILLTLLLGGLLFGFDGFSDVFIASLGGPAFAVSVIPYILLKTAFSFAQTVLLISVVFLISCLFRSRSLAVGISLLVYFVAAPVVSLLAMLDIDMLKYLVFFNLDLSAFLSDYGPDHPGLTFGMSAIIMSVYFIAFMAVSYAVFSKRDVKS